MCRGLAPALVVLLLLLLEPTATPVFSEQIGNTLFGHITASSRQDGRIPLTADGTEYLANITVVLSRSNSTSREPTSTFYSSLPESSLSSSQQQILFAGRRSSTASTSSSTEFVIAFANLEYGGMLTNISSITYDSGIEGGPLVTLDNVFSPTIAANHHQMPATHAVGVTSGGMTVAINWDQRVLDKAQPNAGVSQPRSFVVENGTDGVSFLVVVANFGTAGNGTTKKAGLSVVDTTTTLRIDDVGVSQQQHILFDDDNQNISCVATNGTAAVFVGRNNRRVSVARVAPPSPPSVVATVDFSASDGILEEFCSVAMTDASGKFSIIVSSSSSSIRDGNNNTNVTIARLNWMLGNDDAGFASKEKFDKTLKLSNVSSGGILCGSTNGTVALLFSLTSAYLVELSSSSSSLELLSERTLNISAGGEEHQHPCYQQKNGENLITTNAASFTNNQNGDTLVATSAAQILRVAPTREFVLQLLLGENNVLGPVGNKSAVNATIAPRQLRVASSVPVAGRVQAVASSKIVIKGLSASAVDSLGVSTKSSGGQTSSSLLRVSAGALFRQQETKFPLPQTLTRGNENATTAASSEFVLVYDQTFYFKNPFLNEKSLVDAALNFDVVVTVGIIDDVFLHAASSPSSPSSPYDAGDKFFYNISSVAANGAHFTNPFKGDYDSPPPTVLVPGLRDVCNYWTPFWQAMKPHVPSMHLFVPTLSNVYELELLGWIMGTDAGAHIDLLRTTAVSTTYCWNTYLDATSKFFPTTACAGAPCDESDPQIGYCRDAAAGKSKCRLQGQLCEHVTSAFIIGQYSATASTYHCAVSRNASGGLEVLVPTVGSKYKPYCFWLEPRTFAYEILYQRTTSTTSTTTTTTTTTTSSTTTSTTVATSSSTTTSMTSLPTTSSPMSSTPIMTSTTAGTTTTTTITDSSAPASATTGTTTNAQGSTSTTTALPRSSTTTSGMFSATTSSTESSTPDTTAGESTTTTTTTTTAPSLTSAQDGVTNTTAPVSPSSQEPQQTDSSSSSVIQTSSTTTQSEQQQTSSSTSASSSAASTTTTATTTTQAGNALHSALDKAAPESDFDKTGLPLLIAGLIALLFLLFLILFVIRRRRKKKEMMMTAEDGDDDHIGLTLLRSDASSSFADSHHQQQSGGRDSHPPSVSTMMTTPQHNNEFLMMTVPSSCFSSPSSSFRLAHNKSQQQEQQASSSSSPSSPSPPAPAIVVMSTAVPAAAAAAISLDVDDDDDDIDAIVRRHEREQEKIKNAAAAAAAAVVATSCDETDGSANKNENGVWSSLEQPQEQQSSPHASPVQVDVDVQYQLEEDDSSQPQEAAAMPNELADDGGLLSPPSGGANNVPSSTRRQRAGTIFDGDVSSARESSLAAKKETESKMVDRMQDIRKAFLTTKM